MAQNDSGISISLDGSSCEANIDGYNDTITLASYSVSKSSDKTEAADERGPNTRPAAARVDSSSISNSQIARDEFIEIDPLALERKTYSPKMIFLCTAIYSLMPLASALATFFLLALLFSKHFYVPLLYATYCFLDRKTCNQGGRRIEAVYMSKFWSYLAAHFPIKLRHSRTFKLNPNQNYILSYHPHGIASFGAVTTFATNGLKFRELFPSITPTFMVHQTGFSIPVMKETFFTRGDCSVNSRSIDHMLSQNQKGNLLTIVVGGLAEADLSDMQTLKIVVAERKGFIKKAIIHGASLIPCIGFGENSVYQKINLTPGSFMHRLEMRWYKLMGFKHPLYSGDSFFSNKYKGVLPYKRQITVTMGNPIDVKCNKNPTSQEIDKLHEEYIAGLKALYESNKDLCSKYDTKLVIV